MKIFIQLALVFSLIVFASAADTFFQIPKILWTYWDSGYDSTKLFTKLCINNMAYFVNNSGWKFNFLSDSNYTQYISNSSLQRLNNMFKNSKHKLQKQNFADLIRLFLIYQNGGMWLDTNSILFANLSWIENIDKEKWVYNRVSAEPEIITFTLNSAMGGNSTTVKDERSGKNVYLFPGVEIWSFISKPKSKFLTDVLNRLQYSLMTERVTLDEQTTKLNIKFNRQKEQYFITSNYQFQTILQMKQRQLQSSPNLNDPKYAVQYYMMWSIPSQQTIYGIFSLYKWFTFKVIGGLIKHPLNYFTQNYDVPAYFMKFNGGNYPHINNLLTFHQFFNCLGVDVNIEEGSVIDEFLIKLSPELEDIKHIKMYEQGLMNDRQCHQADIIVESYFGKIKTWISLFFLGAIIINYLVIKFLIKLLRKEK